QQQRRRAPAGADHLQRPDRREPRHRVVADHDVRAGQLAGEADLVLDPLPLDGVPPALHRERDQPGVVGVVICNQQPDGHHVPCQARVNPAVDRCGHSCRGAALTLHKTTLTRLTSAAASGSSGSAERLGRTTMPRCVYWSAMHRLWWVALATIAIASSAAAAAPPEIGGWFGPRVFSASSGLGYLDDAPAHPVLQNGIAFGGRVARPFLPWLILDLELSLVPTSTNAVGGAKAAGVLWFEPRLHL